MGTVLWILLVYWQSVTADTPVDCRFEEVVGTWNVREIAVSDKNTNCSALSEDRFSRARVHRLQLFYPNVVIDRYNKQGTWTLIYNQGFEIRVNNRIYFAFFKWKQKRRAVVSICHEIIPGWAHDIYGNDPTCFVANRSPSATNLRLHKIPERVNMEEENHDAAVYVNRINQAQSHWKADTYDGHENMTNLILLKRAQTTRRNAVRISYPEPAISSEEIRQTADELPEHFDWRNVSGINYVSPVRDQGSCGSCYAFASMALLESRYRILSNNELQPIFSPQHIVSCSPYAQGCNGGFPYLIAGKHGQDFGMVSEDCRPYVGRDEECQPIRDSSCKRYYSTDYQYIGGYYGGCNEHLMKLAIYQRGPITVGFYVFTDFVFYRSGIYEHLKSFGWDPFIETSHAVTVVGYGVDKPSGKKYWIVKNSWGENWGEDGYFRILRGNNECGIESLAMEATPILRSL